MTRTESRSARTRSRMTGLRNGPSRSAWPRGRKRGLPNSKRNSSTKASVPARKSALRSPKECGGISKGPPPPPTRNSAGAVRGQARPPARASGRTPSGPCPAPHRPWRCWACTPGRSTARWPPPWPRCSSTRAAGWSSTATPAYPPPILLSPDGGCQLLDQATDPPLGARPDTSPPPGRSVLPPRRHPGVLHRRPHRTP